MRLVVSDVIGASADRVWDVLADWRRYPAWMPDVAWVGRLDQGPDGPGMRLAVRTKVFGVPLVTDEMTVTAWEPSRLLRIEHRGIVRGTGEWRLERTDGGTRFTWLEDLRMPPAVGGEIGLRLYSPLLRFTFGRSIRNMRRVVEDGPRGA